MAAIGVLVLGESGTGKSTSIRTLPPDDTAIINANGKRLPFKNADNFRVMNTDNYQKIKAALVKAKSKRIVIDDAQYLFVNEFMININVKGYDKYNNLARNFWELVESLKGLDDEKIVYFLSHTETDNLGNIKMKTVGKLMEGLITIEGLFGIVLRTIVKDGAYFFSTQNNGQDTVKTPCEMFTEQFIPNDLLFVDKSIRLYYNMKEAK
ncbi:MAG: ATP-binding protein [Treponema sp.]|jgi:hypothetical protein|nr:ATP-binding protein [Treponema sp.]